MSRWSPDTGHTPSCRLIQDMLQSMQGAGSLRGRRRSEAEKLPQKRCPGWVMGEHYLFSVLTAGATSSSLYLQEGTDLLCQLQKAVLALVQGAGDGHAEPLPQRLGVALVEEVGGRAALRVDAVLQRLCQEDGAGADGAIWGQEEKGTMVQPQQPVPGRAGETVMESTPTPRKSCMGNGRQGGLGHQGSVRESRALALKLVLSF